jgi:hypothetical protein
MMRFSHIEQLKNSMLREMVYKAFHPAGTTFARFVSLSISNEGVVQRRFSPEWRPALHAPLAPGYPYWRFHIMPNTGDYRSFHD